MANTRFQLEGSGPQLYERETVPLSARPMVERMFDHVSLHAGDRVLDVACGTGIVTRVAVERFENIASIVALDLNPGMLEVARENMPTTGIPIEWRQGDMCALPVYGDDYPIDADPISFVTVTDLEWFDCTASVPVT